MRIQVFRFLSVHPAERQLVCVRDGIRRNGCLRGSFALATLSATEKKGDMLALGGTGLGGALLIIPFNWLLAPTIAGQRDRR